MVVAKRPVRRHHGGVHIRILLLLLLRQERHDRVHADELFLRVHVRDLLRVFPAPLKHRVQGELAVREAHIQGDQVRVREEEEEERYV